MAFLPELLSAGRIPQDFFDGHRQPVQVAGRDNQPGVPNHRPNRAGLVGGDRPAAGHCFAHAHPERLVQARADVDVYPMEERLDWLLVTNPTERQGPLGLPNEWNHLGMIRLLLWPVDDIPCQDEGGVREPGSEPAG